MKTSNIIFLAGVVVFMVLIAFGMNKATKVFKESVVQPTGNKVEQTLELLAFDKINLTENIKCTLKKAEEQMVKVRIDEAYADKLKVTVSEEGYLGFDLNGVITSDPIEVTIHYTDISLLTLKSAECTGKIIGDSISHLYLVAGSVLNATIEADYCNLQSFSGSEANLSGNCSSFNAYAKAGSEIEATELSTTKCVAVVSSGGSAKLNVSEALTATAKSGGNISYKGEPKLEGLSTKSGGTVTKLD